MTKSSLNMFMISPSDDRFWSVVINTWKIMSQLILHLIERSKQCLNYWLIYVLIIIKRKIINSKILIFPTLPHDFRPNMLETLWERQVAFAHREVQGLGQDLETFLDLSRLSISGPSWHEVGWSTKYNHRMTHWQATNNKMYPQVESYGIMVFFWIPQFQEPFHCSYHVYHV